jgi:hypothetical protein
MSWKNWGDHPIVVAIAVLSALITVGYLIYDHHYAIEQTKSIAMKKTESSGHDSVSHQNVDNNPDGGSEVDKKEVRPHELTGTVTLSRRNESTQVCLRIYGYNDGMPKKYHPVFHAWILGGGVDIPMKPSLDSSCNNGYVLASAMPTTSRGGTMSIHDDNVGFMDWVLVGNFAVEKGYGCEDVGLVEGSVIKWQSSGLREKISKGLASNKIPINGGYGWVCNG